MPIYYADPGSISPRVLTQVPEDYLVFYSSPDCRDVEKLVKQAFQEAGAPSALIVYVGDRSQWKVPSNPFRGDPWNLKSIPTIVKLKDKKEVARLVEGEIQEKLLSFVKD